MIFKLIQIGLGNWGRKWVDIVLSSPEWRYTGLVTRNNKILAEYGKKCHLEEKYLFNDLESALQKINEVDAVLITTPYFRHTEDILLSLKYGKNVLVEKPLCDTLEDADNIKNAVKESGKTLMISEDFRFRPAPITIRDLIRKGKIGSPEFICIQYFINHIALYDDWRLKMENPILIENATHHYDLLRFITGKEAVSVSAFAFGSRTGDYKGNFSVSSQIEMEDGLYADFCASWAFDSFTTPWEGIWWIRGTKGGIYWKENEIILSKGGKEIQISSVDYPSNSLKNVLDEFTESLKNNRQPSVDIENNLKTFEMVIASIKSSNEKRVIAIKDLRKNT